VVRAVATATVATVGVATGKAGRAVGKAEVKAADTLAVQTEEEL